MGKKQRCVSSQLIADSSYERAYVRDSGPIQGVAFKSQLYQEVWDVTNNIDKFYVLSVYTIVSFSRFQVAFVRRLNNTFFFKYLSLISIIFSLIITITRSASSLADTPNILHSFAICLITRLRISKVLVSKTAIGNFYWITVRRIGRRAQSVRQIPRYTFNDYYSKLKRNKIVAMQSGYVLF